MDKLLAYLAIHCRVDYISDLSLTPKCKKVISSIDTQWFSLEEWTEVVHYLCKNDMTFDCIKSAKEYLIKYKQ